MTVPLTKLAAIDPNTGARITGPAAAILILANMPAARAALADPEYRRLVKLDSLGAWATASAALDARERDALAVLAPATGMHRPGDRVHVTHGCDGPATGCVWHTYTTNTTTSHGQVWPAEDIVEVYVTGWGVQSYLAADVHPCPRSCTADHSTRRRAVQNARNLARYAGAAAVTA